MITTIVILIMICIVIACVFLPRERRCHRCGQVQSVGNFCESPYCVECEVEIARRPVKAPVVFAANLEVVTCGEGLFVLTSPDCPVYIDVTPDTITLFRNWVAGNIGTLPWRSGLEPISLPIALFADNQLRFGWPDDVYCFDIPVTEGTVQSLKSMQKPEEASP